MCVFCVCGLSWSLTHGASGVFLGDSSVSQNGLELRGIPPIRLPASGNWMVVFIWQEVCLDGASPPLLSIRHLSGLTPPLFKAEHLWPNLSNEFPLSRLSNEQAMGGLSLLYHGQEKLNQWQPVCFFYLTNSTPHLHTLTKTTAIKQAPYIHSPAAASPCHTHSQTTFLHPYPPHSPTPHTHKHTWPTSFPVRHESDSCSAFTGVIHGY